MRAAAEFDIYSPDGYADGPPHEVFAELRRTQPVFWQEMPDGPGYWAVLKHADVITVGRSPDVFSASAGGVVVEDAPPDQIEMMRMMMIAMDPPRHRRYRQPLAMSFHARTIAALEERVRAVCKNVIASTPRDRTIEFTHEVAAKIPSQVFGELMGLPEEDWDRINSLAEIITGGADAAGGVLDAQMTAAMEMAFYAIEFAARRRTEEPRDDLTTLTLAQEFEDGPMTDADFGSFFVQLVTAGNETTKTMMANGLLALLQHPEQLEELRSNPALVRSAVEEILRYANSIHYFRRTAARDVELNGAQIRAGDKVAMIYTSANRDEDVFDEPQLFDIHRDPNPHLAFGAGEHSCLGVHLARLEGRVFFEQLIRAVPKIEQAGAPVHLRSNLNNSLKSLPVRFS